MYERSGRRADRLPSLACWQPRNLTSVDKASQLSQVVSRAPRPPGSARADSPGVGRKVNVKRAGGGRDLLRRLSSRGGLPGRLCVVMLLSARAWPDGGHRGGRVVGAPPTKGRISRNRDALRSELINKSCLFYFITSEECAPQKCIRVHASHICGTSVTRIVVGSARTVNQHVRERGARGPHMLGGDAHHPA